MNDLLVPGEDGAVTLLEIDLRSRADAIDEDTARQLVRELAYLLMYEASSDDGLPYGQEDALRILEKEYDWLIAKANYKRLTAGVIARMAKDQDNQRWDELFEGRRQFAAMRFRDRIRELDRMFPILMKAIQGGSIGAVSKYVQLVQLDQQIVGYGAPTRYEFNTGDGESAMTDREREEAQAAMMFATEFEQSLLPEGGSGFMKPGSSQLEQENVVEGEFSEEEE